MATLPIFVRRIYATAPPYFRFWPFMLDQTGTVIDFSKYLAETICLPTFCLPLIKSYGYVRFITQAQKS